MSPPRHRNSNRSTRYCGACPRFRRGPCLGVNHALPVAYPFRFSDYVGYTHVTTKDDSVGAVDEGDEFVTYVFRLKERIGRKWITL